MSENIKPHIHLSNITAFIEDVPEPEINDEVPTCDRCGGGLTSVGIDRCHCSENGGDDYVG